MHTRTPLVATICGLLVGLAPRPASANGAAWKWPLPPGTPGPVRKAGLVLEKETVVFRDGTGVAAFSVRNETERPIATPMGFPLAVSLTAAEHKRHPERLAETAELTAPVLAALRKATSVEVEGKRVPIWLSIKQQGDYELVVGWRMTYPARGKTIFVVSFPLRLAWSSSAGTPALPDSATDIAFKYITHTGAYWAKPIGEATFRFCDARMMELHRTMADGREWVHDGWSYGDIKWTVAPAPFSVDRAAGCIVWERKRWTPRRGKDDLLVHARSRTPSIDLPDEPRLLDRWCARYQVDYSGDDVELRVEDEPLRRATQHLGAEHKVDRTPLDRLLAQIEKSAWERLRLNKHTLRLPDAPPHYRAMVRLRLLEYLRNYFYGVRDHAFKIERLRDCYAAVKNSRKDPLTALERRNIQLIQQAEVKTAAELKTALEGLRRAPPRKRGDLRDWWRWPSLAR